MAKSPDRKEELQQLVGEKIEEIEGRKGRFAGWYLKLYQRPFKRQSLEIRYDWCTIHGFADRVRQSILNSKKEADPMTKRNYATVEAYLTLAKLQKDPGQAWNHINSADKLLPLVMDAEGFERCLVRLRGWDERLFEYDKNSKKELDELDGEDEAEAEELYEELEADFKGPEEVHNDEVEELYEELKAELKDSDEEYRVELKELYEELKAELKDSDEEYRVELKELYERRKVELEELYERRKVELEELYERRKVELEEPDEGEVRVPGKLRDIEYRRQSKRAQLWYSSVNAKLSLNLSLWRSYTNWLLVVMVPAILVAEYLYCISNLGEPLWFRPFLTVSLMGILGGRLSAKLMAGDLVKRTTSIELIKVLTLLRMFIGGAGAFVVYAIFGSGIISGPISELLNENIIAVIAVGIVAGFSEQLYVQSLDKSAQNLLIVGRPVIPERPE